MRLKRQRVHVAAPRELTFEVVAAAGKRIGETDNGILVEFETQVAERVITTVEEVELRPPDAIRYRWVEGPLEGVEEEIRFADGERGGTLMTYSGTLAAGSGARGWLRTIFVVRPTFNRLVAEHLEQGKRMAQTRAERSRVHPRAADA